jgi:hypothetical protein
LPKRLAAPAASRKDDHERRVDGLLAERDRLMGEISLRARLKSLPPMLVKARTLLTRFWGRASWDARSEILAVARMLLTLGAAQPVLRPQLGMQPNGRATKPESSRQRKTLPTPRRAVETT